MAGDLRDVDLESVPLGPASYMTLVEPDAEGKVVYQVGARPVQTLSLGKEFGHRPIAVVDTLRITMLCDPATNSLYALSTHAGGQRRIIFFGVLWGWWIDEAGHRRNAEDPMELMANMRLPVSLDTRAGEVSLEFYINIYNRDAFSLETRRLFQEGPYRYLISLTYAQPSGDYIRSNVAIQHAETGIRTSAFSVRHFPLAWPTFTAPQPAPQARRPSFETYRQPFTRESESPQQEDREREPPRIKLKPRGERTEESEAEPAKARAKLRRPAPESGPTSESRAEPPPRVSGAYGRSMATPTPRPPSRQRDEEPRKPAPLPKTEHLGVEELIRTIRAESGADRRWKIVESNLMMARPERTYTLIANFAELIEEKAAAWPPARLHTVFRDQPGSVLIGIMEGWAVNQVLVVAEGNSEQEKIIQWLREREVDRLLRISTDRPPATVEAARSDLNVDRTADPVTIKRTWRTLLGFLNADHGRQDERAIHRKKDEIAKHLQEARNLLLKQKSF